MNNTDLRMIEKAVTLCETNPPDKGQQRVAAIVTDSRGNILSSGINSYSKTHPLQAKYANLNDERHHVFLHAEIAALVKNRSEEKASKIYVARLLKNGEYALAKPCPMCSMAIKEAGIEEIIYTEREKIVKKVV